MLGRMLGQGRKSEVYECSDGVVIKLFFATVEPEAVEVDYAASRLASDLGLPCPRVLGRKTVDGRAGILFERVDGPALLHVLMSGQGNTAELAQQFGSQQAKINQQRPEGLPEYRTVLLELLNNAPEGWFTNKQINQLADYVRHLPEGDHLCHMDYHPDNVLVETGDLKVIDWAMAMRGPAVFDFAYSLLVLTSGDLPPGLTEEQMQFIATIRKQLFESYVESYTALSGLSLEDTKPYTLASQLFRLLFWQLEVERPSLLKNIARELS
ncbi:MAG: phosphotransferase family protein [Paracoccus sp. (in: a-proteobacteria)]